MGIRFTETLAGYLGQGDDHRAAWRAGRAAGRSASFTITVRIPDLAALEADPEHVAPALGTVRLPDIGEGPTEGRVHLFCRRDGEKRLLYHLPFSAGESQYLLRGEKRLSGSRRRRWQEMTTLYADLVSAGPGSESLLARGLLTIGPWQVLLQTLSFRPEGPSGVVSFARDWLRFLRFSSREMAA